MSFLKCRHNVVTQKHNIPCCFDCTGFHDRQRTTIFKKVPRIKEAAKPHQAVTWGKCNDGLTYSRGFDFTQKRLFCIFTSSCIEGKRIETSTWRSASIVDYVLFVQAPCNKVLSCFSILPGFCTDTDQRFLQRTSNRWYWNLRCSPSFMRTVTPCWCFGFQILYDLLFNMFAVHSEELSNTSWMLQKFPIFSNRWTKFSILFNEIG